MYRFIAFLKSTLRRLYRAMSRFPLTLVSLLGATILICYMISLHSQPEIFVEKLAYTFLLGAFLGVLAQFACERFRRLNSKRLLVYVLSTLLTIGYYLILIPVQSISHEVVIRTGVAVVAMFCAFIWVPSFKSKVDFNEVALVHFKSAAIAILYAVVLSAGCASLIAAVDMLLFEVNSDIYLYTLTIIWVLFATLYYLSLLPCFNAEDSVAHEYAKAAAQYPRFLEILISYIAIPLLAAYTVILTAYFIKILFTLEWPSGQIGGMVFAYSIAGLLIYILASLLQNRFAQLYRIIFPKVLIPIVIMQLVSVGIRLNAYGFTESRYYIVLFGIFALFSGLLLSFKPVSKNGLIALLAASLAIVSVIPPVDAFTISRNSQINRLEDMLKAEGMLTVDKQITPKAEASQGLRFETTNILNYLQRREYTEYVQWLPADFSTHKDMKALLGFDPTYSKGDREDKYFFAYLESNFPLDISGYDVLLQASSNHRMLDKELEPRDFLVGKDQYSLVLKRSSTREVRVMVLNAQGNELISSELYDFARSLALSSTDIKETLTPAQMTLDVEENGYRLRIILQDVTIDREDGVDIGADYGLTVLFAVPPGGQ